MMSFLLEPLEYEFFRRGLLAALMIGTLCGLIGVFIVVRGMSYVGHGLSHAAIGGAIVGITLNVNFYVGACAMGLLAMLLINRMTHHNKIKLDAAIGLVTTAMFALGVAIISKLRHFRQNFEAILFGNILGISDQDLLMIGSIMIIAIVTIFFTYRPLLFSIFDHETARIFGIRTTLVQLLFSLLLTFSVIASLNVVGVTMVAATLIAPAMTARILTHSFNQMIVYSIMIGAITGVIGMYLSYIFNAPSGTTIVLFGATLFCLTLLARPLRKQRLPY